MSQPEHGTYARYYDDYDHISMCLSGERLDAFREAVGRCAMPGQPGTGADGA